MRKWRRYGRVALTNTGVDLLMRWLKHISEGLTTVALLLPATRPRAAPLPLVMLSTGEQTTTRSPMKTRQWPEALRVGLLPLFLLALPVSAQNIIQFTADVTTGVETVVPVLTWDTIPLADDCVASGDWSGSKGAAGTETLPAISGSATYNIQCDWLDSSALLTWTIPTQNTDGTAYTDPKGFRVYYDMSQGGPYVNVNDIADPTASTHVVAPLIPGVWFFVVTAYNQNDVESDVSNEAMKILGLSTETESVGITVNPKPASPVDLIVQ